MTSSFSAVDKPGVNSRNSSNENSSFGSGGDSRAAAADSAFAATSFTTEASDSIATPQAENLGLLADVGSSSLSSVESSVDVADATADDLNKAPVDEPVLHSAGCACAACRGGSRIHSWVQVQGLGMTCQPPR